METSWCPSTALPHLDGDEITEVVNSKLELLVLLDKLVCMTINSSRMVKKNQWNVLVHMCVWRYAYTVSSIFSTMWCS